VIPIKRNAMGVGGRFKDKKIFIEGDLDYWFKEVANGELPMLPYLANAGNPHARVALEHDRYSQKDEPFYAAFMGTQFVIIAGKDFKITQDRLILL